MKRLMTALLAAVMTVTMAGTALAAEDPGSAAGTCDTESE